MTLPGECVKVLLDNQAEKAAREKELLLKPYEFMVLEYR